MLFKQKFPPQQNPLRFIFFVNFSIIKTLLITKAPPLLKVPLNNLEQAFYQLVQLFNHSPRNVHKFSNKFRTKQPKQFSQNALGSRPAVKFESQLATLQMRILSIFLGNFTLPPSEGRTKINRNSNQILFLIFYRFLAEFPVIFTRKYKSVMYYIIIYLFI